MVVEYTLYPCVTLVYPRSSPLVSCMVINQIDLWQTTMSLGEYHW